MRISNYFWSKLEVAVICKRIGVALELNFGNDWEMISTAGVQILYSDFVYEASTNICVV